MFIRNIQSTFNKNAIFKYNYVYKGKRKGPKPAVLIPTMLIAVGIILYLLLRFVMEPEFVYKYILPVSRVISIPIKLFTGIFPFVILEILVICAIPLVLLIMFFAFRFAKTGTESLVKLTSVLFSIIGIMIILFSLTLGAGYYTLPLEVSLGLENEQVGLSGLRDAAYHVARQASLTRNKAMEEGDPSMRPKDYYREIKGSYKELSQEYPVFKGVVSRPKKALLSVPLSHLGIGGIFSPFTCEAIINVDTTPSAIPFSSAHEMAHSLSIARENEANFAAFLACITSGDSYTEYSGYFNALLYLMNSLYKADVNEYKEFLAELDGEVLSDINAYFDHNRQYQGKANEIQDKINDAYLKSNGQSEGVASYGMIVELLIKWHESSIKVS